MNWHQLRTQFPGAWVLVEAVEAHSEQGKRVLDDLSLLRVSDDSTKAMQDYPQLHHHKRERELYVLHTDREQPKIEERRRLSIRKKDQSSTSQQNSQIEFAKRSWERGGDSGISICAMLGMDLRVGIRGQH